METWTGAYGGLDHSWTGGIQQIKCAIMCRIGSYHREIDSAKRGLKLSADSFRILTALSICIY
jgi:hypothetical protein